MKPISVVIVDDCPCLRQMLSEMFQATGDFEVLGHGRDGEEAAMLAEELQPNVIVMDVDMPGADGIEALPDIRSRSSSRVVLLARAGSEFDRETAYGKLLGAAAVLQKPDAESLSAFFDLSNELLTTVQAVAA